MGAAKKGARQKVVLACKECKNRNYDVTKNKKNTPDRVKLSKYCNTCKTHTEHQETK